MDVVNVFKEQTEQIHRTWVQMFVDYGFKEVAAIAIDTELLITNTYRRHQGLVITVTVNLPSAIYAYVIKDEHIKKVMVQALSTLLENRMLYVQAWDSDAGYFTTTDKAEHLEIEFGVKLLPIEKGWKDTIRELIATSSGVRNQGTITELVFGREKKEPLVYNGLKFASQSEIRIAQEFEQRKVLFFPLIVGVRAETGQQYKDHREIDFLVCDNGTWGILEISYHPDRFEKDAEKDAWFKHSGILCVEHRTAEQCYNNPKKVADDFLSILAKHKK